MAYSNSILEEELKIRVANDLFHAYDCKSILGKIDFCVRAKTATPSPRGGLSGRFDTPPASGRHSTTSWWLSDFCPNGAKIVSKPPQAGSNRNDDDGAPSLLWAEAKAGEANPYTSLVQLILTIGKARTYNEYLPPPFLSAFDARCIAFLPYTDIMAVFSKNDFNWNVTPSNYDTREFKELYALVKDTLKAKALLFYYDKDDAALKAFIKENFVAGRAGVHGIQIDKNNFTAVYAKWRERVMPTIICDWEEFFGMDIIDADFYLADLLSSDDITIREKLAVLLKSDKYTVSNKVLLHGHPKSLFTEGYFNDGMKAHKEFWRIYVRPPQQEYWDYIVARRDLLVPQDIRERKGSFFTPRKWVELSQEYIAHALGENWQDEYTVWDTCAGTGNLLAGLTEKYNVYASTLDKQDVDVMRDRIANGAALLDSHVFQFDFLNDDLMGDKVPQSLREILADTAKRKKLLIYMNPPYAEAGNARTVMGSGNNRGEVSNKTKVHGEYSSVIGNAIRELFAQFLIRIYKELPGCIIANFSKLKGLQSPNFGKFREVFCPALKSLFLIPSYTFDNVKGKFPIGFFVWDTNKTEVFKEITADVYDAVGNEMPQKTVYSFYAAHTINEWLGAFVDNDTQHIIGSMCCIGNDFQHQKYVNIALAEDISGIGNAKGIAKFDITRHNLIVSCIYFACRHVIPVTWPVTSDQFLYPNDGWKDDALFQTDCLVYTLFNGRNRISSRHGTNHWIPFTEQEVDAGERFESHFMTDFIGGKIVTVDSDGDRGQGNLLLSPSLSPSPSLSFSPAATAVMDAGREVWRYYHSVIKDCFTGSQDGGNRNDGGGAGALAANHSALIASFGVNASLYDIREYFQGRDGKGRMNSTSNDAKYTQLMAQLRTAPAALAVQIERKVYEYGFLKK